MVLMTCMWARLEILLAYLSTSSSIGVLITRHSAIVLNNIVIRAVKYKQTFAKLHSARWSLFFRSVKLIAETKERKKLGHSTQDFHFSQINIAINYACKLNGKV